MQTADFHYDLPPELVAQQPAPRRDGSRLLVLHRENGKIEHRHFSELPDFLEKGDVLVLNNSRVIPARLHGKNPETGGKFEILLLEENDVNNWWAMMRPGKRAKNGVKIQLLDKSGTATNFFAKVLEHNTEGHRRLEFSGTENIFAELEKLGEMPLPPYIDRPVEKSEDRERYQTVFAQAAGSVAAPTAGLHFTPEILEKIRAGGVTVCFITLHVGAGTFLPVKVKNVAEHKMHGERFEIGETVVAAVNAAKKSGKKIYAAGTTATRALETVARQNAGMFNVYRGKTDIFIFPPAEFKIVDSLLTNFHLPESTLLMLVSAFAAPGEKDRGRELVLKTYAEAIREKYRFFSYGDAMLIL
ncbi:MAG TPA: tRNA preQ1(34) S-adenosylmethionine ribosyltransferase-isomerase QueA [Candidatus Sulfotelmatobacter sp.]|nr:tRNA preQ1(34) S-adenosylmethionine ribosyltransferase-isomerase QueA [Candidatus Sulfotelmatobacter sp.]